ncbi:MAG TPA: FecR domain-containing protein [Cyclobacteriaceae bacterium]|nr:FecR domain-containing protein [Cyclobacteriaceae bacterium]
MAFELNDIDDLIGKALSHEATTEELREVELWRKASPENEKYYLDMELIFSKAAGSRVKIDFDTDAAWRKVKDKLSKQNGAKPVVMPQPGRSNWTSLRIAAGIVLIITAGIFAWRWFNRPTQTMALATDNHVVQDTLPDGSTAFLNKKSSITFEYNPRKKIRKVKLKGEGFFDVKHEEEKPFVIETEETLIRDLGTSFNIKSYPDKDTIEVVVQTGVVQFYTLKDPGMTINAGETGFYSKRGRSFTKLAKADTNVLAYKTKVFSFHNTDLKSVIDQINEVYDSKIVLANNDIANCQLTTIFRNEELDHVVEIIAESFSLTVERNDKHEIILNGPGCR